MPTEKELCSCRRIACPFPSKADDPTPDEPWVKTLYELIDQGWDDFSPRLTRWHVKMFIRHLKSKNLI